MGYGTYSLSADDIKNRSVKYSAMSSQEIFKARSINSSMSPFNITVRESRDSAEHPNSLAIVLALDVTGSMGSVPNNLIKNGLPTLMSKIIEYGIKDPQVLFLGIGDHTCDNSPLQVGQFESSDSLLDKWLTDLYLEGGGGGNEGESYLLAWYFAARHTSIDCFEKRNEKGFLFTIGDEPVLNDLNKSSLKEIMGEGEYTDKTASYWLSEAQKKFNVYHINICETSSGSRQFVKDGWKQLLNDNCLLVQRHTEVAETIAKIVCSNKEQVNKKEELKVVL